MLVQYSNSARKVAVGFPPSGLNSTTSNSGQPQKKSYNTLTLRTTLLSLLSLIRLIERKFYSIDLYILLEHRRYIRPLG